MRAPLRAAPFVLLLLSAGGCYRPRLVDCVVACGAGSACPGGMTCSAGLCTRGPTCVTDLGAGSRHSCAIRAGAVACWGDNHYGQLGTRAPNDQGGDGAPIASVDLGPRVATAVVAGGRHSCALTSSEGGVPGGAVCWGDNSLGQLGVAGGGTRGTRPGDTFDSVPLAEGDPAAALAAGLSSTCALLAGGSVVCWGDDRFGQLGIAPAAGAAADFRNADLAPVALAGPATAVAAGAYHACALLDGGAVQCWGWNDLAQLGDGDQPGGDRAPGRVVTVALPAPATAIAAGAFHGCALLETGAVTCWGHNDAGQLGIPRDTRRLFLPPGPLVELGPGRTAHAIGAGTTHTCALLDDFTVKCWGFNLDGELGVGDARTRGDDEPLGAALPRVALGPDPVSRLAVGAHHACAIQTAGVKCWGFGDAGRLGAGDLLNRGDTQTVTIVFARLD